MRFLTIATLALTLALAGCDKADKNTSSLISTKNSTKQQPDSTRGHPVTKAMVDSQHIGMFIMPNGDFSPVGPMNAEKDEIRNDAGELVQRTRFNASKAISISCAGQKDVSFIILGNKAHRVGLTRVAVGTDGYAPFLETVTKNGEKFVRRRGKSFAADQYTLKKIDEGTLFTFKMPLDPGMLLITYTNDGPKTILVKIQ